MLGYIRLREALAPFGMGVGGGVNEFAIVAVAAKFGAPPYARFWR